MTKPVKITPDQEQEIARRHRLSRRALAWIEENGRYQIHAKLGLTRSIVSRYLAGEHTKSLTDQQKQRIETMYRRAKKVQEIQRAHSARALRREYGISPERINAICRRHLGEEEIFKPEKKDPVGAFMRMQLTRNPCEFVPGYY